MLDLPPAEVCYIVSAAGHIRGGTYKKNVWHHTDREGGYTVTPATKGSLPEMDLPEIYFGVRLDLHRCCITL